MYCQNQCDKCLAFKQAILWVFLHQRPLDVEYSLLLHLLTLETIFHACQIFLDQWHYFDAVCQVYN